MNKRAGRPKKYFNETDRKEAKRIQNRLNQQCCRERKKQKEKKKSDLKEIYEYCDEYRDNEWNKQYNNKLVAYFSLFNYDYYLTGTIDMRDKDKNNLKFINEGIRELNNYLDADISYVHDKKVSVKSLVRYTERFVAFLLKNKAIDRCFWVVETGKFGKCHVHIILKSHYESDEFVRQFEDKWLMGILLIKPIYGDNGITDALNYSMKEFKATSKIEMDKIKIDNWSFAGDFDKKSIVPPDNTVQITI